MNVERSSVLILSSDPAFLRAVPAAWPHDGDLPDFTLLEQALGQTVDSGSYELAIVDVSAPATAFRANADWETSFTALTSRGEPLILVYPESSSAIVGASQARARIGSILPVSREYEFWPKIVALLGREVLRRVAAERQARDWQQNCAAAESEATLGRYMVEMRHSVNNALTSVLGNAELLFLEPGLPASVQEQSGTIRNMALRLNEVFRRFSSIEKELRVAAQEKKARAAGAGR
jgi:signal transduction histidine kinase